MSYLLPHESGGVFIKPSARRSIHDHIGCQFARGEMEMGRYAYYENNSGNSMETDGADEVDNAWSQPAHPIRSPTKPKSMKRRKSADVGVIDQNDDSDVLSKSAPPTLFSRLYYSDQTDDDDDDDEPRDIRNNSCSSINYSCTTPNRSNSSRNTSNLVVSTPHSGRTLERGFNPTGVNKTFFSKASVSFISLVVVLCGLVCSGGINIQPTNVITYDKAKFLTDVSAFGEKYSVDSDSILQVQMGISTIYEREDTGSFIFVYNSKADNFDASEFNKFVNDIALSAAKYLRNASIPLHYTTVDGSRLDMAEHSELICRYRVQLGTTGVMLLRNLEAVPSKLAMAFHYYCDEYNPLVRKTAVLFTMDLASCHNPDKLRSERSLHTVIEKCLRDKWSGVSQDSIAPLLTRVVSVVVDLTNVF